MKVFDILNEKPGDTGASALYRGASQQGAISNDDMASGRFADMAKRNREAKLKQKQAATNKAKSKQTGIMGQIGKQRAAAKALHYNIVADPQGLFYQWTPQETEATIDPSTGEEKQVPKMDGKWAWQAVEIKNGPKPEPGTKINFDASKHKIQVMPGTYPLKDKDALSMDLTAIAKGVQQTKGTMDKFKDRAVDAMGGPLASKTMSDPNASTAQKIGGVAGAALGRMAAKAIPTPQAPAQRKDPTRTAQAFDLDFHKNKILDKSRSPEEKIAAAEELLKSLQAQQAKNVNVDKYVDAMGPMLKASGLNKSQPQWYGQFVQKARAMRVEAFEFMNKVLEYWNMSWEDIGYKVVLSENESDDVLLIPTTVINEAVEIENLKVLAGV